ncbi:hypothetical protein RRG08_013668 [Elysia crispata]|uniref:Uncharacterized protein n=1 Tax=Elysia crispata TaxID=231223 RepID=A0AAE1DS69_9GAST|nr:hypothetical protein RRG08_013668 [Elysia crispata]
MAKDFINMNKTTIRENAKFLQICMYLVRKGNSIVAIKYLQIRMYSLHKGDPIVTIKFFMNARAVEINPF